MSYEDEVSRRFVDSLTYFTRFLGVATAVVIWGIGFDMVYHSHTTGIYIILISILIFFFEVTWAISLFLRIYQRNESESIVGCWIAVLWLEFWKKTVVYWAVATVLFVLPHKLWLTPLAGGMLVALGCFHLIEGVRSSFRSKAILLQQNEDLYDRFDEDSDSQIGEGCNEQESESVSNTDYVVQV